MVTTDAPRRDLTPAHEGRRKAALKRRLAKAEALLVENGYQVVGPAAPEK